MPQPIKRKKFKSSEVEEYMKGKYFSQWEGIRPVEKARWSIKVVVNARDKRDFDLFSGFHFETIEGTKNYYSIRIGGQWRCFFIWENSEAREINISKHENEVNNNEAKLTYSQYLNFRIFRKGIA